MRDCGNRAKVRAVGTALSRAAITGGRVAQCTAYVSVASGTATLRLTRLTLPPGAASPKRRI